ncbi:MAG TPA: VCBS repeat-containing protein [Thiobacillus sp.]
MNFQHALLSFFTLFILSSCGSANVNEAITDAHYAHPVERYGHFALGKPHEYASLVATTRSGRKLTLQLPHDEVFEDKAPRLVRLAENEAVAILAIVSHRNSGARLVLIRPHGKGLAISAQSPAIGTPNRWLNPVGVADLDGDGHAEIAAVITPHIGGTLKAYREQGKALIEIASLWGFSNHHYGSAELGLSTTVTLSGRQYLLVPDTTRLQLRLITLENEQLVEAGRCALSTPITGAIRSSAPHEVSIVTQAGQQMIALDSCMNERRILAPATRHLHKQ